MKVQSDELLGAWRTFVTLKTLDLIDMSHKVLDSWKCIKELNSVGQGDSSRDH